MKTALFGDVSKWLPGQCPVARVYGGGRRERLAEISDLYPEIVTSANFGQHVGALQELEAIFSTWGMPPLTEEQIEMLPRLKVLFYAAGASSGFRGPFEKRGITVCSATAANAIPVAEFALSQVLLAGAGFFRNHRGCTDARSMALANNYRGRGNYGGRVAVLGDGTISKKLQGWLAQHDVEVVVVSSWEERRTCSLDEAFATSFAVVNLFPNLAHNGGILNEPLFRQMMDGAVFINVGRGQQVNETDLIRVLKARPDLTAVLDVQSPEPPENGSELYVLPNVVLTGHIAGSKGDELFRLADYMLDEFQRYAQGLPLQFEVPPDQL